jgi:hypothetical protein
VRERLNRHAWRACDPRKGSVGSNPTLSASKARFGDTDWKLTLSGGVAGVVQMLLEKKIGKRNVELRPVIVAHVIVSVPRLHS